MTDDKFISAELLKTCYTGTNGYDDKASYASIRKMIDSQPAIDPETLPIVRDLRKKLARYEKAGFKKERHGHWMVSRDSDVCFCSECGLESDNQYPYCHDCGSILDEPATVMNESE